MRFDKIMPSAQLQPYIKYFVVSENDAATEYKVLPSSGLVIGFQYKGQLSAVQNEAVNKLAAAGITGITDAYKIFRNTVNTGSVLVYFTETGFVHFSSVPANEIFNQSISLEEVFTKNNITGVEERLSAANNDNQRINIVEQFLLSHLKDIQRDKTIIEAVKLIYQSKGNIRIKELNERLFISQSPFEKRFRKVVGTTPKKFSLIVRLNAVINDMANTKSLTEICYENNFFDQAHFIKDFKRFTGDSPERFKSFL